ncbi:MAG: hypothetical protein AB7S26_06850 [Sandaracinaceae bacterium]
MGGAGAAWPREALDRLPDVRDGLTRVERVILYELHRTQKELGGRNVPTAMLYGRVVEHVNLTPDELSAILARLIGTGYSGPPVGSR